MNNSYAKFCSQYMYTDENLNDAQLLKFVSKSGRSRVEDSPPTNLQTVVIGQLFNFNGNGLGLVSVAEIEAKSFNLATQ